MVRIVGGKKQFLIVLLSFFFVAGYAQRKVKADAHYVFYAPEYLTVESAKNEAVKRAQIQAIADEFGTLVQQQNVSMVSNTDESSTVSFSSIGTSDVRGEWLKTIGKPVFNIQYIDGQLVVEVSMKGEIREIEYLKPQFIAALLRNGTTDDHRSDDFRKGDFLYLSFLTPVEGYLAVFAKDDSIRALLPDLNEPTGMLKVPANKRQVFFSEYGQRLRMVCSAPVETNAIYILFSPHPVICPVSERVDDGGLPVFTDEDFHKWLAKMRTHDKDLQVVVKYITIKQ